jgi:hypothetical protein
MDSSTFRAKAYHEHRARRMKHKTMCVKRWYSRLLLEMLTLTADVNVNTTSSLEHAHFEMAEPFALPENETLIN